MKGTGKRLLCIGCMFNITFVIWTLLIQKVDVRPLGVKGTDIGFATLNCWFHNLTGVHMKICTITDWLGLVPIFICIVFGVIGFGQLMKRRSILKVDYDLILLGVYYIVVIFGYLIFEMIPINYRPILIEGFLEASYPSSTTLLVLCVMPTLMEQVNRRTENETVKRLVNVLVIFFLYLWYWEDWFPVFTGLRILWVPLYLVQDCFVSIKQLYYYVIKRRNRRFVWNFTKNFKNYEKTEG